jgi:nitrous oxidase accessory protein
LKYYLFYIIAFLTGYQSVAETFVVDQSGKLTSIKSAVEKAKSGDTIFVMPGVYREGNIIIQKSLTIIGKSFPLLDGELKYEIFTIAAKNVVIEGFHFKETGRSSINDLAAVKGLDAHNLIIRNNKFEDTFFAIHISNSEVSLIENNNIKASAEHEYQSGNGIHLWKSTKAKISNNNISGHRDGIYFEFVTNSLISGNTSEGNLRYGLHFMFSHNDDYENNIFRNNGAGVAVMYTTNVTMIGNTFEHNWGSSAYGMLLKDIRDSKVFNNRFVGNTIGIYMEGTSRTIFENNFFSQNGWAVKLQASCDDNVFKNNNFIANTFDIATNGTLVLNKIDHNYWDKYQGYDLNRDGIGDIPFHPVSLYTMIVEQIPVAMMLWRSFLVYLLDKAERVIPAITPIELKDNNPLMKPYDLFSANP